jgi:hypothetical protein
VVIAALISGEKCVAPSLVVMLSGPLKVRGRLRLTLPSHACKVSEMEGRGRGEDDGGPCCGVGHMRCGLFRDEKVDRRRTSLAFTLPSFAFMNIVMRLFATPEIFLVSFPCTTVTSTSTEPSLAITLKFFRTSFSASGVKKDVGIARAGSMTHAPLTLPSFLTMVIKLLGLGRGGDDGNGECWE